MLKLESKPNYPPKSMHECEVWIDVECTASTPSEVVCTLLATQSFATRPLLDERLNFMSPMDDSAAAFKGTMAWGPMQTSGVSTEVEEVSHYRGPKAVGAVFKTSLRCRPARVPTLEDARLLVEFMCSHHGFELDPYGVNKLSGTSEA